MAKKTKVAAKENSANSTKSAGGKNPIVTLTMECGDIMEIELCPDVAKNTVNNFISLVESEFYNGLTFHRVIDGFMIQGGDPDGNGMGGPGYGIKGEFASNGVANDVNHEKGVISMARSGDPDSAGSQFFIMVAPASHLNGQYAAFGKVINGIEALDKILAVPTDRSDKPTSPQVMKTLTVEKFGIEYDEPTKRK